jgi:hypothetical protein
MKRVKLVAGMAALLLAVGSAQAAPNDEVFEKGKPLAEQISQIERQLNDGETYSELKPEHRSEVRETLARLYGITERYSSQTAVPEEVKVAQFNDQARVNTILTQAREDSRMVCKREKATGSNRTTTQCMTVAQRERAKQDAQKRMGEAQRTGHSIL